MQCYQTKVHKVNIVNWRDHSEIRLGGEINTSLSVSSNMESRDTQNNIYIIYNTEEEKVGHCMVKGRELGRSQA